MCHICNCNLCAIFAALGASYSKVVHLFRRQYNRSNADTNIGFNLQIAFNLTMTHMSCLLFQDLKIRHLTWDYSFNAANRSWFHMLHKPSAAAAHLWHMTGAVGAARMHGWCISLPHCWPLFPSPFTPQRCLFSSAVHATYIKRVLPFRPVTLHCHSLGLHATFLNEVQWAVCCTMQQRVDRNAGFLKHKTSGWHVQQAQYRWRHGPEMTAVCGQHRPVFAAFTAQESADVNHCSSSRTLPAHPLLRMNGYGTDRRGKMLLRRCVNNPGWIERCLFSLAYFSQVRDEKKEMRGAKRHSVHSMTPDSARLLKGWYQTKCV